jgi:ribonuclease G
MDKEGNRRKVWDAFQKALTRDRSRTNVTKISELGLVEMTRKRTRESLVQLLTEPCPTCEGSGVVKSVTTVAYEILREVRRSGTLVDNDKIDLECAPRVAEVLQRQERDYLDHLEKRFQKKIEVVPQKGWKPDQFRVAGKMSTEIAAEAEALAPKHVHNGGTAHAASSDRGGDRGGGDRGGGGGGGGDRGGRKRRRRGGRGRGPAAQA